MDTRQHYDASRVRIVGLLDTADPATPVPACPGWTVKDLVAHLAGGLGDFVSRDLDAGEHANHGERTVAERRHHSIEDHLDEWGVNRERAEQLFDSPMGGLLVTEVIEHEHDLRGALDVPGARDDPAVTVAIERPLQEVDRRLRDAGDAAVELVVDGDRRRIGDGPTSATLRVDGFELLRALGGRRSPDQLRGLDWDGPPRLDLFGLFGPPRTTALVE